MSGTIFLRFCEYFLWSTRRLQKAAIATYRSNAFSFHQLVLRILSNRKAVASGGTVGLSLSLFGKYNEVKKYRRDPENAEKYMTEIVSESDALYDAYLIDHAYDFLKKFDATQNPEILWRLARVLCEKGKITEDKEVRKKYMFEALEIAKKALDNEGDDGCFGAHKWYAILLNYVGDYRSLKERIKKAYDIRYHFEKALSLNGDDATTWHLLVAKAIFLTPPSSTYEEALKCFEKAEFISPNFYSTNVWYMGEVYDRLGQKGTALAYYLKAFKMPVVTVDDKETHQKAMEKLVKAGIDCKYLA